MESLAAEAYLNQYVEAGRGEPARWHAVEPHAGLSQRRIRVAVEAVMNNVRYASLMVNQNTAAAASCRPAMTVNAPA